MRPADPALGPPRRFFWTRRAALAQTAPGSRRYVRQVPDQKGDRIHAMIAFINLLSAETIDNTANIRDQAPRFIGKKTIAGIRWTSSATDAVPIPRYGFSPTADC